MIITPLQFEGFNTRTTGDRILRFSIYQEHAEDISEIINGKIGQEFIGVFIQTSSEEHESFQTETEDQTKERFWKHMHALIKDIEKLLGISDWKEQMKKKLIQEGKIRESTKELDLQGLAQIIIRLKKYKHELERKQSGF